MIECLCMRDVGKGGRPIREDAASTGRAGGEKSPAHPIAHIPLTIIPLSFPSAPALNGWPQFRDNLRYFEIIRDNLTSRQGEGGLASSTLPRQNDSSQFKQIQVNSSIEKKPPPTALPPQLLKSWGDFRAFILMILSSHDSVSRSSLGRACRIPPCPAIALRRRMTLTPLKRMPVFAIFEHFRGNSIQIACHQPFTSKTRLLRIALIQA
jgi:hypothetical protein